MQALDVPWYFSAKVLWPLFPLLLLVVVVCLTWALVHVVRRASGATAIWLQGAALGCYLLAAVAAIASERGGVSANIHRPFSLLTQVAIAFALFHIWRKDRSLVVLNATAWAAILADTALHFVLTRG
ncbi:MAG: hypothetical protein ACREJU_12035 [Nitrospiraceae bacterium]